MAAGGYGDFTLYRRLVRQALPFWTHMTAFLLLSLLSTPLALLLPVPLKVVVDSVLGSAPLPGFVDFLLPGWVSGSETGLLIFAAGSFLAISLLRQLQALGQTLLQVYTTERLTLAFRAQLFRHAQRLSISYHDSQGTADSIYRIQYDATTLPSIVIDGVVPFITSGLTLASMLYVIAILDWQLAIVGIVISPALVCLSALYRQPLRNQSRQAKRLESSAISVVQEVLSALRVVKAFSQEEREQQRFVQRSSEGMRSRLRLALLEGAFGLLVGLLTAGGSAAVLLIGAMRVQSGALSLGELLLVMSYLTQFYDPLRSMSKRIGRLQSSLASAERAFALLDHEPDVRDRRNPRSLTRASGQISFENVSFGYLHGHQVIKAISFDAQPGARVGIAGATGAGKTTLLGLLMRFYDPDEGRILLDGRSLSEYRVVDLRNQFTTVLQDTVLFSATIAENIAYARPGASRKEIIAAAQAACAHEFIIGLPEGYETVVGERGMRLSGGERQRVALARAFLKDAPILILDEPTSSVDSATERSIMQATRKLMEGRTTFIISHRLSALRDCDLRIDIEDGEFRAMQVASARTRDGSYRRTDELKMTPSQSLILEHPAAVSWLRLARGRVPDGMETIKEERKSSVLRLRHAGPLNEHVIAKREDRGDWEVERTIYEHVLPRLPLPSPEYYGCVEVAEEDVGWIFLEDAGDGKCPPSPETSAAAARWLAGLHTQATSAGGLGLPTRAASHYLEHLQSGRDRMRECRDNPALKRTDLAVLEDIAEECTTIEQNWADIERLCESVPKTIVHGDFIHKNMRLRSGDEGTEVLPFDWENAGYGTPAADLAWIDAVSYYLAVSSIWPHVDFLAVQRLVRAARIFRLLASVHWEAHWLAYQWVENPMANMRLYRRRLKEATRGLSWWL